jgi:glycosyltransferase involved in cell wall biosynthesis
VTDVTLAAAGGAVDHRRVLPVTVVVPVYERVAELREALESVWAQTALPAEVVVVDDASPSAGVAEAASALGAKVVRLEANAGPAGARNAGAAVAAGEWLAFLDSDDTWVTGHLELVWSQRDGVALVATTGVSTDGSRRIGRSLRAPRVVTDPAELIVPVNPIGTSGVLIRREDFLAVGGFGPYGTCEDLDLWVRATERGAVRLLPDATYAYRIHPVQLTKDPERFRRDLVAALATYVDRPWWRPSLLETVQATHAWDRLRAARARGDRREALRHAAALAPKAHRLVPVLRDRWQARWAVRRLRRQTALAAGTDRA